MFQQYLSQDKSSNSDLSQDKIYDWQGREALFESPSSKLLVTGQKPNLDGCNPQFIFW